MLPGLSCYACHVTQQWHCSVQEWHQPILLRHALLRCQLLFVLRVSGKRKDALRHGVQQSACSLREVVHTGSRAPLVSPTNTLRTLPGATVAQLCLSQVLAQAAAARAPMMPTSTYAAGGSGMLRGQ
jgi:hypothetical protein